MAAAWLESQRWETALEPTGGKGHATELSRNAAASGCDVVVACGGDGTINEVANGLAGSDTALAVIRGGTANVWAKEVGVPREPLSAVRLVAEGRRRRMDLGLVRGEGGEPSRFFLLMAGVGLDGYVVSRVPERLKQRLGAVAYVLYGLRESLRFRPEPTSLLIDGEAVTADLLWLLAANTRSYGGVIEIARDALADDGLLDVYLFEGRGVRQTFAHGLRILRRKRDAPGVVRRRAAEIEIASSNRLDCQVDGESLDFALRSIGIAPRALTVMLPAGRRSPLFSEESDG
jgi:diacylglycerol kinase (ATP)